MTLLSLNEILENRAADATTLFLLGLQPRIYVNFGQQEYCDRAVFRYCKLRLEHPCGSIWQIIWSAT